MTNRPENPAARTTARRREIPGQLDLLTGEPVPDTETTTGKPPPDVETTDGGPSYRRRRLVEPPVCIDCIRQRQRDGWTSAPRRAAYTRTVGGLTEWLCIVCVQERRAADGLAALTPNP